MAVVGGTEAAFQRSGPILIKCRGLPKGVTLPDADSLHYHPLDTEPTPLQRALACGPRWLAMLESGEVGSMKEIARRRLRQEEREPESITHTDFFPGELQTRTRETLAELVGLTNRRFSPQEPSRGRGEAARRNSRDYVNRLWATRRHLWVDRVASAWLIRQFIDSKAHFLWLENPAECPADALGFDFDGAAFTHVGERVTFEVLLASFGLEADAGLVALGRLVHFLDVGGEPVAEAAGFEAVLAGLREGSADDDELLATTAPVLNALYRRFSLTER
jgi:hypothetical protein